MPLVVVEVVVVVETDRVQIRAAAIRRKHNEAIILPIPEGILIPIVLPIMI